MDTYYTIPILCIAMEHSAHLEREDTVRTISLRELLESAESKHNETKHSIIL